MHFLEKVLNVNYVNRYQIRTSILKNIQGQIWGWWCLFLLNRLPESLWKWNLGISSIGENLPILGPKSSVIQGDQKKGPRWKILQQKYSIFKYNIFKYYLKIFVHYNSLCLYDSYSYCKMNHVSIFGVLLKSDFCRLRQNLTWIISKQAIFVAF